jgi:hypothetical protein
MVRKTKLNRPFASKFANFWAFMTVSAFPLGMLCAMSIQASTITVFAWGVLATLAVLTANALCEGQLWMFAPEWRARFEHPEFSFRLAVVSGAILLILQTTVLVMLFADGGLDRGMLRLVFERQCSAPKYGFNEFCNALDHARKSR